MSSRVRTILIHGSLFLVTFVTTTLSGSEWVYGRSVLDPTYSWVDFTSGFEFSVPFLAFLTFHEFGHYIVARLNRIRVSLPYYIPLPPISLSIGTLGAIIRIRQKVPSSVKNFDVGIAGPLSGFIISVACLLYGFSTLPPPGYIFRFHPEYEQLGPDYAQIAYSKEYLETRQAVDVRLGDNLLMAILRRIAADPARVPNAHELMHYPWLLAGFLGLVFTSLNLLPVGQLDGGHVSYGLFGAIGHRKVAVVFFIAFLFYAGLGYFHPSEPDLYWKLPLYVVFLFFCLRGLGLADKDTFMVALIITAVQLGLAWMFPHLQGYPGWLLFAFILGRFVGIRHPGAEIELPLDDQRRALGWLAVAIFFLTFTPNPLEIVLYVSGQ